MPFNIYTFVLSEKLASDEFAKRGVSDTDSVRRTALITGFLSPPNGGINGAVVPALIAKEKASRDAAAAEAAAKPVTSGASEEPTIESRLAALESAFATYTDFEGKKIGEAKPALEKDFDVEVKDDIGNIISSPPLETTITTQRPNPKTTTKLLKGTLVTLIIPKIQD